MFTIQNDKLIIKHNTKCRFNYKVYILWTSRTLISGPFIWVLWLTEEEFSIFDNFCLSSSKSKRNL